MPAFACGIMVAMFLTGPPAMKNSKIKKESVGQQILRMFFLLAYVFVALVLCVWCKHLVHTPSTDGQLVSQNLIFVFLMTIGLWLIAPLLLKGVEYRNTKEHLQAMEELQSTAYTDEVIKLSQQSKEMTVALPIAWDCLKEATNGLDIKAIDKRRAAWLIESVDDASHTVKCKLEYFADPLGRKLSQIYPRTIEMVASVDRSGVNTKLRTRYTFPTPMDLEAVSEIISKTNLRLNEIIETADKSIREQREARSASTATLVKQTEFDIDALGTVDFPLSLN